MQTLTSSRMKVARACLRLHKYEYIERYRPAREADDLRFGTLFHAGQEAWWNAWQRPADERLALALAAVSTEADPFDRVRAEELLAGYHARWLEEPYEVLGVEIEFSTALRNPTTGQPSRIWVLGGKIDVVVRDLRTGDKLTVEHKTSSEDISPGSEYWRRLKLDGQVSTYHEGARALGHEVAGCLYDVAWKPAIRPLKATPRDNRKYKRDGSLYANQRDADETPENFRLRLAEDVAAAPTKYFARGMVVRLESELREAAFDAWQLAKQLREAELAERAPRNPDACSRYGRTCAFLPVCCGEASLEDPALYRRSASATPELAGPKEEAPTHEHDSRSIAATPESDPEGRPEAVPVQDDAGGGHLGAA